MFRCFGAEFRWWFIEAGRRTIVYALMRAIFVVIRRIILIDIVEMAEAEAEDVIENFFFHVAYPRLAK